MKYSDQLRCGQKQRVTIPKALINETLIIIGDEPTGNLDKHNGDVAINIFTELAEKYYQSILIVTHDLDFAAKTHRSTTWKMGK